MLLDFISGRMKHYKMVFAGNLAVEENYVSSPRVKARLSQNYVIVY